MQIKKNKDNKEIKNHGDFQFPVLVSDECLSNYDNRTFAWHWHPEIELTVIIQGEMVYKVSNKTFHLNEGDMLFVNANALHMGKANDFGDCIYISTTFEPKLIYGYDNSIIQKKYIDGIIFNTNLSSMKIPQSSEAGKDIRLELLRIHDLYNDKTDLYELEMQVALSNIWIKLMRLFPYDQMNDFVLKNDYKIISEITCFIHENYRNKLTLDEIAASVSMSKGQCCKYFKMNTHQTIFEYILEYRIKQSMLLLKSTDYSITEIACLVGFSDPGYYSKIFYRYVDCTPSNYKKNSYFDG